MTVPVYRCGVLLASAWLLLNSTLAVADDHRASPLCLHLASGSPGEEWTDGVERSLRERLENACQLETWYLGTRHKRDVVRFQRPRENTLKRIEAFAPDAIITSGDAAAELLLGSPAALQAQPVIIAGTAHARVHAPTQLQGITGMVERTPILPMIREAARLLDDARRAIYIAADTPESLEDYRRLQHAAHPFGLTIDRILTNRFAVWQQAFEAAQHYDLALLGDPHGIRDWDDSEAHAFVRSKTRRLALTNSRSMVSLASVGFTKVAEEHGDWAGRSVLAVLSGTPVSRIPLLSSRQWETWINLDLMSRAGLAPDRRLLLVARQVDNP